MLKLSTRTSLLFSSIVCFFISSCSKEKDGTPSCTGNPVSVIIAPTIDPCIGQGSITVTSPTSAGTQYRINNSPYQSSPVFNGLLAGSYTITAKDENGCASSASAIISSSAPSGPLFNAVRSSLTTTCTSCHGGSNPQAGLDFSRICDIVNNWDRIRARAVDAVPSPMPPTGLMPTSERNKIIDWINAGHRYTD